ncbi:MAG: CRTAC1 family protein [Verrucomicrobiales bacterium]
MQDLPAHFAQPHPIQSETARFGQSIQMIGRMPMLRGGFPSSRMAIARRVAGCADSLISISLAAATAFPALGAEPVGFIDSTGALLPGDAGFPFFSGVAMGIADMDGDGKDDIIRFQRGRDLRIEYQGAPGEAFAPEPIRQFSGIRVSVAAADFDRSGRRDLVCGGYSGGVHLFTAAGESGFAFATLPDTDIIMQGMNFTDIDRDGFADIFACDDDDDCHRYRFDGTGFALDPALIDTFIPPSAGQDDPNAGNYASVWTDYDNDGDLDLYLSKCWAPERDRPTQQSRINRLFRNDGGAFTDVAAAAGLASGAQSWCADFADVDNDGDLDAFVVNHVIGTNDTPSAFYRNNGDGTFTDATAASGIAIPFFGVQAIFRDFNNDAFVDLLVSATSNGYRLFLNEGDGTFAPQAAAFPSGGADIGHIQSFAVGDLNDDGWLDVYAGRGSGLNSPGSFPDRAFLNSGGANHFLKVRLAGRDSNPDGIGARLELHGAWGVQVREVRSGEGYGVMHSLTQHFGIGSAESIDRLVVRWPSGAVDAVVDPAADQTIVLTEGTAPMGFEAWRAVYFSPDELLDPAISGAAANPDGDLLANLFEWYFRRHPKDARSTRARIGDIAIDRTGGAPRLVFTVERHALDGATEFAEVATTSSTGRAVPGGRGDRDHFGARRLPRRLTCGRIDPSDPARRLALRFTRCRAGGRVRAPQRHRRSQAGAGPARQLRAAAARWWAARERWPAAGVPGRLADSYRCREAARCRADTCPAAASAAASPSAAAAPASGSATARPSTSCRERAREIHCRSTLPPRFRASL